jgi:copper homeostasis protein
MNFNLEIIAFNIESCSLIEQAGAHRIELCDNAEEGGTTASHGFIKMAREKTNIQLFPIIRPRGGDFLYSSDEFAIMKEDIKFCKDLNCDGVVIGLLLEDGKIDYDRTSRLVQLAYPMEVTFHRAFDRVADPLVALEQVIKTGCTRILTSGLFPTAIEGRAALQQLVKHSANRIVIMPGSGIRSTNIVEIAQHTGAFEFHASARKMSPSRMVYHNGQMKEELNQVTVDQQEISRLVQHLKNHFKSLYETENG